MTRSEFKKLVLAETLRRHNLMFGVRGPDYAQDSDALANFKQRAELLNNSPIHVCLGDASKHWAQVLGHFCAGLPSKGQAIVERLDDLQNYIDLLRGLMKDVEE